MSRLDPPPGVSGLDDERARELALFALHTRSAAVLADAHGFVEWVNPAFSRVIGYPPEVVLGKPLHEAIRPKGADDGTTGRLRAQLARGEPARVELRASRRGAPPVCLQVELQPVRDASGLPVRFLVLVTDLTDQRAAEELEGRLREQALAAQRRESLRTLAAGVARSLEPILHEVTERADRTVASLAPEETAAARELRELRRVLGQAHDLRERLLAVAGLRVPVPRSVDLSELVLSCAAHLEQLAPSADTLCFDLASRLPGVRVDPGAIRWVVEALVANACEAVEENGGTIRIRTGRRAASEELWARAHPRGALRSEQCVFLEVRDTGAGLDPNLRGRALDPFVSTRSPGRGLGLAEVLGIVEAHRAGLLVESQPGLGTTITVLFPCAGPGRRAIAPRHPPPRRSGRPRRVVLLVEDDERLRERTQRALRRASFRVLTAGSDQALDRFRTHAEEIDLTVLSPGRPGSDGREILRRMRLMRPNVRFVIATPYADEELEDEIGGDRQTARFLQKPYSGRELVDALRTLLAS